MRADFARAAEVLNGGGVAVIPTDTVYGLAARPDFPAAVDRLYAIKGRAARKPIALLASDIAAVERFGYPLSFRARELAERHWPGALTLVLPPAGLAFLWRRGVFRARGRVLLTALATVEMAVCFSMRDSTARMRSR